MTTRMTVSDINVLLPGDRGIRIIDAGYMLTAKGDELRLLDSLPKLAAEHGLSIRISQIDGGPHHGGFEVAWSPLGATEL